MKTPISRVFFRVKEDEGYITLYFNGCPITDYPLELFQTKEFSWFRLLLTDLIDFCDIPIYKDVTEDYRTENDD